MERRSQSLIIALAFVASPAIAHAGDDPACAKYREALAYNACLASHGPKANIGGAHGDGGGAPARRWASGNEAPNGHRAWPRETRRRGRARMEFEVR